MGWVLRGIDWVRDGYAAIVGRLVRVAILGLVLIGVSLFGIQQLAQTTPTCNRIQVRKQIWRFSWHFCNRTIRF